MEEITYTQTVLTRTNESPKCRHGNKPEECEQCEAEDRQWRRGSNAPLETGIVSVSYPGQELQQRDFLADLEKRTTDDQVRILSALDRYEKESEDKSYQADFGSLVALLDVEKILTSRSLVDLGCGSGDLLRGLASAYPDKTFLGIELAEGFVDRFNTEAKPENASMRIGLVDSQNTTSRLEKGFLEGDVISVLTLDRVADPLQLIRNMGRFQGSKILVALLPYNPKDDNPSIIAAGEQRTYTAEDKQILSGETLNDDIADLSSILVEEWTCPIGVATVPYTVTSASDVQEYRLTVFYSK